MTYRIKGKIICVMCKDRPSIGRKLCRRCYTRAATAGTLDQYPPLGPHDVFENRIKKTAGCWLWRGTRNGYGYGIFLMPGEKPVRAHRYSYEYFIGKIPDGMVVMHTCDNPPCVNPKHLRVGTKAENNADTKMKRRHHYGTDHWNGRLTAGDVAAIIAADGPQSEIAKQFNISQSHVSKIKAGQHRRNG